MYLEEIEAIRPCTKEEQDQLLKKIAQGDDSARERLVEGSLGQLVELAKEYDGQGVLMGDLIQEANIALLTALAEMAGAGDGNGETPADFEVFLNTSVRPALDAIVEEQMKKKSGRSLRLASTCFRRYLRFCSKSLVVRRRFRSLRRR